MVLEALLDALGNFWSVELWLFIMAGTIYGVIGGILPGVGGLVSLALFMPFIFLLSPEQALPFMVAVGAVLCTGGSVTAILLNVPGTTPNAATLIDGYPMTQKGEAGRALGAGLTSSAIGGLITPLIALAIIPVLLFMLMAIHSADLVFLILLGISCIAVLGRGSTIKGLVSAGVGFLLAFIGFQVGTGVARFTFGSLYLYDGINLVPLALGIFAVSEMVVLATRGGAIAKTPVTMERVSGVWQGVMDTLRRWKLVLRSSIIGFIVGVIPGIGGTVSSFIAYAQAKQTSKQPERFGTGFVDGVIAPESANNAKEGGALLCTLALGIPGAPAMALILGAFLMLGLIPGPEMLTRHLDLSLTLLMVVIVANVIGVAILLPLASRLSKIALIPGSVLVPLVMAVIFMGTFIHRQQFLDLVALLVFGLLGLVMMRYGYDRPVLLLAFILGSLFEKYLFIALKVSGLLFFLRPIALTLIFIMIAIYSHEPIKRLIQRRRGVKLG